MSEISYYYFILFIVAMLVIAAISFWNGTNDGGNIW